MKEEEKRALVREIIKRARKCKGMTQSDLAKVVGVATAPLPDLQPLPDLLVVTDNGPNRIYHSSSSAPDVMGYINSLQERVQALEDKLQRIEKAFKGDKE